jgi:hypothetical protein
MPDTDFDVLLARLAKYQMSEEEREAQRRSFAYGNVVLSNPNITRELIDKVAADMKAKEA